MNSPRHRRVAAAFLVLVLAFSLTACPQETYRKVLQAENGVASSIGAGTKITADLYDRGMIDQAEKNVVANALLTANNLLDQFNQGTKRIYLANGKREEYFALAESLLGGVKALHAEGKLGIKNATAKIEVDAIFAAIESSIGILKLAISN